MKEGKANIVIDGQFGSTGKGLLCGWLAKKYMSHNWDAGVSIGSPNAGHTWQSRWPSKKIVCRHFPVSSVVAELPAYLSAGAIVDPKALAEEVEKFNRGVWVSQGVAVVNDEHVCKDVFTKNKIASTGKGVGPALMEKISRTGAPRLADDGRFRVVPESEMRERLRDHMGQGGKLLVEVPQGVGLGINSGMYPHVTSREIGVSQALADCGLHPSELGDVYMTVRPYPIRVGNTQNSSGPFWPDSEEISWEGIGVEPEFTTVTGRMRRVASFSWAQFRQSVAWVRPTHIFANFCNYHLDKGELWLHKMEIQADEVLGYTPKFIRGLGPNNEDVKEV